MRVVYRHFVILGQESQWAAEASECAAEQQRFWVFHDRLLTAQSGRNQGAFAPEKLAQYAVESGLEPASFNACVASGKYRQAVQDETEAGRQKGVRATPSLLAGALKLEGVPSMETIRQFAAGVAPVSRAPSQ